MKMTSDIAVNWDTFWKWQWEHFQSSFARAGFSDLRSHRIEVDGKERIMNVAVR